jgi:hypothetical protein
MHMPINSQIHLTEFRPLDKAACGYTSHQCSGLTAFRLKFR